MRLGGAHRQLTNSPSTTAFSSRYGPDDSLLAPDQIGPPSQERCTISIATSSADNVFLVTSSACSRQLPGTIRSHCGFSCTSTDMPTDVDSSLLAGAIWRSTTLVIQIIAVPASPRQAAARPTRMSSFAQVTRAAYRARRRTLRRGRRRHSTAASRGRGRMACRFAVARTTDTGCNSHEFETYEF